MDRRSLASLGVLAAIVAIQSLTLASAATKAWTPPRTADGQPDLQGIWISKSATPLERPRVMEGRPLLSDEEVRVLKQRADRLFKEQDSDFPAGDGLFNAVLANPDRYKSSTATGGSFEGMVEREFERRTSLIVDPPDGRVPPLTPEGRRRLDALLASRLRADPAGPEDLSNDRRCITFGVPRVGGNYGAGPYSYNQIVQSPGYVVLVMEYVHEARIIPLDGRPHLPTSMRQWNGDSVGRWEGNTLIVDTTNFSSKNSFMGSSENLHLVERFTRVSADAITYEVTFDDPATWSKAWTASLRLTQTAERIYEVACHEGNHYSMDGILAGARAEENVKVNAGLQQPAPSSAAPAALDFDYFKTKVQPIFLAKRPGHARCISCHSSGTPLRLQPLSPGSATWNDEDSRKNFEAIKRVVVPGSVAKSPILTHPLAERAGGDFFHSGGKHWDSQSDPEWQTLKAFVVGR
jgi:hypothetical protein